MFNKKFRHLSDEALIGFYVLFVLNKMNKQVAVLSYDFLKKFLPAERVTRKKLQNFESKIKHLFDTQIEKNGINQFELHITLKNQNPRQEYLYLEDTLEFESMEKELAIKTHRVSVS